MNIVDFAGIKVDNVTLDQALEIARHFVIQGTPRLIVTPNPEIIVTSQNDNELKEIINSASLRVPDGISMVVVSKIIGTPLKERVSGIDLMLKIAEESAKYAYNIFLLGGAPGIAEEAAANLTKMFPGLNLVGTRDGYCEKDSEVIKEIKDSKPDILFVGLGACKQEKWASKYLNELNVPVVMTIGGSLDVLSGRKKRAPKWIQALYIEWLYRLITEPGRWKRQLALPKFLYLTLLKKRALKDE